MKIDEIIRNYTANLAKHPEQAKQLLEEANAQLAAAGASPLLAYDRNSLTPEEVLTTTIGQFPHQVNGYGLMCTGTGVLDKVHIQNGVLDYESCDLNAMINVAGRTYYVEADQRTLTEEPPAQPQGAEM